jgi:hypothetical protein
MTTEEEAGTFVVPMDESTTLYEEDAQQGPADAAAHRFLAVETFLEENDVPNPEKRRIEYPDYNPVDNLLSKLEGWLLQQPEWAVILAAPRKTRRQAITLISKRLLTIPTRGSNFGQH